MTGFQRFIASFEALQAWERVHPELAHAWDEAMDEDERRLRLRCSGKRSEQPADTARSNEPMDLRDLQAEVHALAREKGWWDLQPGENAPNIPEKLALIHSEISEALEEFRRAPGEIRETYFGENGKPEGFPVELADAVIRIMDLCGWLGIDLESEIARKHEFNKSRPYRHGKAC